MSRWVGFNQTYLPVKHAERAEGESSYSFKTLIQLAFDNMIAFSDKPIRLVVKLGAYMSMGSFIIGIFYLVRFALGYTSEPGFTTLTVSIWFLSGMIIFILGIIGIYVSETFKNTKDRPLYIIHKILNDNENTN